MAGGRISTMWKPNPEGVRAPLARYRCGDVGSHARSVQAPGDISLYWTGPTGKTVIGGFLTPGGIRVSVVSGETFAPLARVAGLGAAAW